MIRSMSSPLKLRMPLSFSNTYPHCPPAVCRNSSLSTSTLSSAPPSLKPILTPSPPTSAYIHLPFCRKRCHYCDFPIIALGSSPSSAGTHYDTDPRISNYIDLILREIEATGKKSNDCPPLETIFFGGGTPSLVPPRLVAAVLDKLHSKFSVSENAEISIEMDPGTFDAGRVEELVGLGVNRVSLGVQAFQEELLRACGRAHGVKEVYEAIDIVAGSSGLENWSIDLISSLPHQTLQMWEESLKLALDSRPTHVSVYDLQVEQGTKFGQLYTPGEFPLPTENQSADFYKMASETLSKAGFHHYEISSYCRNGYECKHNLTYWDNRSFYGFGLGSASYTDGIRFSRPGKLKNFTSYVQKLEDGLVDEDVAGTDSKDMAMDVVMLSLRTARGLDMKCFARDFGNSLAVSLCKAFEPYMESGHVVALDEERRTLSKCDLGLKLIDDAEMGNQTAFIRLSDPEGFLLSNELISIALGVISPK